jgi:hypothetical protein
MGVFGRAAVAMARGARSVLWNAAVATPIVFLVRDHFVRITRVEGRSMQVRWMAPMRTHTHTRSDAHVMPPSRR